MILNLRLLVLLLAVISFCNRTTAQALTAADFEVGWLKLRVPVDSILIHLPKPDLSQTDGVYQDYLGLFYLNSKGDSLIRGNKDYADYVTAEYRGLVVWYNKHNKLVKGFDIQESPFTTARGVRVGDSVTKLRSHYGNGNLVDDPFTDGPYDLSFHQYSEIRLYSSGDYHLAFFSKAQRVTKIIFFFRLTLTPEDWRLGFLKLDEPFNATIAHLGKPDSTTPGDYESTGFYYPKLVLWRDDQKGTLCAMDIYDSSFVTHRGLGVGSPSTDIEKLYGDRGDVMPVFERFGPYDYTFRDYSESIVFEGGYFFVVFSKEQRVVKMLLYVGVDE